MKSLPEIPLMNNFWSILSAPTSTLTRLFLSLVSVFVSNLIQSSNQSHHYLIIPLNLRAHIYHINIYNAINLILCVHAVVVYGSVRNYIFVILLNPHYVRHCLMMRFFAITKTSRMGFVTTVDLILIFSLSHILSLR